MRAAGVHFVMKIVENHRDAFTFPDRKNLCDMIMAVVVFNHESLPDVLIQTTVLRDESIDGRCLVAVYSTNVEDYFMLLSQAQRV